MTQEEKAKAYDEAIKRAKNCLDEKRDTCLVRPDVIFPELKESEDERIRKAIINVFEENIPYTSDDEAKKYIAWLEKQGKQNHTDSVAPKFKVGDWVVQGHNILKIKCVGNTHYCFETVGGYVDDMLISELDSQFHLWTIEDAKDCDVLAFHSEYRGNKIVQVGIIEKYVGKHGGCSNTFKIYVGVNWDNNLQIDDYMGCSDILPATKEQRDILYKAMGDAGYAFDFGKKELKKVENKKPMLSDFFKAEYERGKADAQKHVEWSEEDERIYQCLIEEQEESLDKVSNDTYGHSEIILDLEEMYAERIYWLKSIKQRIVE